MLIFNSGNICCSYKLFERVVWNLLWVSMINFWNATCNTFNISAINHVTSAQNDDTNCTIVRDLRLLTFRLIHARSTKRNIKYAKLNVYSLRVLCKFAFAVKSAFPSERIYLSRAKDPSLDSHVSLEDWFKSDVNVKIRCNACPEINNFRKECDVGYSR